MRWFGHVERKSGDDWVSACRNVVVAGARCAGKDQKTWSECVKNANQTASCHPSHCSHVFLLLSRPLALSTTNPLQADTQSSTLLRSRCPNHLNLPRLTTSATQLIPRRLHKSSLRLLSFQDTPYIHLTIIRSVLSKLFRSSAFHCPGFSSIYQNTLDTSTIDPSFDTMHHANQNKRKLLKLGPSTSHSSSSRFHYALHQNLVCRPNSKI